MNVHRTELALIEQDLLALRKYEGNAKSGLAAVADADCWQPSDYEKFLLPGLRLVGVENKNEIILQNVADLHIHTQWSDGDKLENVLAQAAKLNLDAIAITDHDEIGGALEARKIVHQRRLHFAVVPGSEISSRDGHIGALFITKKIPAHLSAEETVQQIHDAGGIAVAHHPYSPKWIDKIVRQKLGCGDLIRDIDFDAIEATNAVPGRGVKYNIEVIDKMREHHLNIAVTGSSDAHTARFIGKGKTYWAGNNGIASLYTAFHYGFTQGAEAYWKTSEKFYYYSHLIQALIRNRVQKRGSIN
jgi:predicted metal-dependent phosphoesterase TrpH